MIVFLFFAFLLVCRRRLDLALLIDGSGSINAYGRGNFRRCLNFVKRLVASFSISPTQTRVGIVLFSTRSWLIANFRSYRNKQSLLRAISRIRYPRGGTKIGRALRFAKHQLFRRRTKRRKVGIEEVFPGGLPYQKNRAGRRKFWKEPLRRANSETKLKTSWFSNISRQIYFGLKRYRNSSRCGLCEAELPKRYQNRFFNPPPSGKFFFPILVHIVCEWHSLYLLYFLLGCNGIATFVFPLNRLNYCGTISFYFLLKVILKSIIRRFNVLKAGTLRDWLWCYISNTSDSVSSGYPNTEKRVENTTRSGVFLTKFEVFG